MRRTLVLLLLLAPAYAQQPGCGPPAAGCRWTARGRSGRLTACFRDTR
jgi:hypothetical protein